MLKKLIIIITCAAMIVGFTGCNTKQNTGTDSKEIVDIQILSTADIHGKFYTWDYLRNVEDTSGSFLQIATAIAEKRNENTLVFDAGDLIQNNNASFFLRLPENPMATAMNYIGYDAWVAGNHEFNYGMDILKDFISQVDAKLILGNFLDENGKTLGEPYAVFERGGVRIGVVGVVTPNIAKWDAANLAGCSVLDPVEVCRKAIDELKGKTDVLIALTHMGVDDEYDMPNSGVTSLAEACPEFDVIISSHEHKAIEEQYVGDVLIVQSESKGQTMNEIHITLEKTSDGYEVLDKTGKLINIEDYPADETLAEMLEDSHEMGVEIGNTVIGTLVGGNLTPENQYEDIPQATIEDTPLIDLINKVMLHYSGAQVSAVALTNPESTLKEGAIRLCDMSLIYSFDNTLYKFLMTGAQLKKYMEWSAQYFLQWTEGDEKIAINPDSIYFNYDMFSGVNYEVNISNPEGNRIENLTWPDGTPVKDDDEFTIVVNNYRATTQLLDPGQIFDEGNMPALLEKDIASGEVDGIREMITQYIISELGGTLTPEVDYNWKLVY